jgi:hypothetical protein
MDLKGRICFGTGEEEIEGHFKCQREHKEIHQHERALAENRRVESRN